jgi:hypothetical protein
VQQRGRRLARHAVVAVGGAGGHALEQGQHAAHAGMRSSAATKCISDVPGLAKHSSTPLAASVVTRDSAPFMGLDGGVMVGFSR